VLCTAVNVGTRVSVASWFDGPDNVQIAF